MPTLNKLEYLDETKQEIKTALNTNFNSQITDEDTFRSYVSKIDNIYNNWPKVTGEGTEITLSNVKKGKMPLQLKGNTEQDSYSGINLLPNLRTGTITDGNVTFIVNEDKSITINCDGTGTSGEYAYLTLKSSDTSLNTFTLPAGTYTRNGSTTNDDINGITLQLRENTSGGTEIFTVAGLKLRTTTLNSDTVVYSRVRVSKDVAINNITIYPMIVSGEYTISTIPSYEPYVGGTSSPNPDYPQDIRVVTGNNTINQVGTNLIGFDDLSETTQNGVTYSIKDNVFTLNGTATDNIRYLYTNNWFLKNAGNYSLKFEAISGTWTAGIIGLSLRNSSGGQEVYHQVAYNTTGSIMTKTYTQQNIDNTVRIGFYINKNSVFNNFKFRIIYNEGSTAQDYEPYQRQTYSLNLGSIELCKIGDYQDYIYKDNGKWYKHSEINKIVLDGSESWFTQRSTSPYVFALNYDNYKRTQENICKCNFFLSVINGGYGDLTDGQIRFRYNSGDTNKNLYVCTTVASTINDFKTWLSTHNTEIYYVLATPTNTEITDTTLITQLEALNNAMAIDGTNNISSEYATGNAPVIISASALMKGGN